MTYSYDYYLKTCANLKLYGFNPKRILDIGANVCQTADVMRYVWPNSDILLFEGNKEVEYIYKQKNYNYQLKLLGNSNSIVKFYKTKWSPLCTGNSIYKENSNTYDESNLIVEELPIYKLDDCVHDIYDLIKIDTQGSELDIINGGERTFSSAKVIITEVSLTNYNEGGCTKQQIINKLLSFNFDLVAVIETVCDNKNNIIAESLMFIKP